MTAAPGTWSGTQPITFAYQWRKCTSQGCSNITGATSTQYTAVAKDLGASLRVRVKATNADGAAAVDSRPTDLVGAPRNTQAPTLSGTAQVGSTLHGTRGTWIGQAPLSFRYVWERCDSAGDHCVDAGDHDGAYTLTSSDIGHRMGFLVAAKNSIAERTGESSGTAIVVDKPGRPVATVKPIVAGQALEGQTLTGTSGTWTGTQPITLKLQWWRCDQNGNGCHDITGANAASYVLTSADVGHRIRLHVHAANSVGTAGSTSDPTALVAAKPTGPAGAITLGNGQISIPVTSVSLPDQLIIDADTYTPNVIRSRAPFQARFHVVDAHGYVVRDALVYMIGLPYGRILNVPEQPTGQDGWVTMTVQPTAKFPLVRGGALVIFVRARKAGDNLLAGVSARRLVQVRTGPPA
jgi:hypothetical protein